MPGAYWAATVLTAASEDSPDARRAAEGNERALRRRHLAWYAALAARQEAFGPGRALVARGQSNSQIAASLA